MEKFVLSERELGQLFIMLVLAALLFGVSGLVGMLVMQWVTRQRYAKDSMDKHGISRIDASRLGGVVILGLTLCFLFIRFVVGHQFSEVGPLGVHLWGWVAFLLSSCLGLIEDIDNDFLSPHLRLSILGLFFGLTFLAWPEAIPRDIGYQPIDWIMSQPAIGWALAMVFCVGFINAVNMADGANGLVPGIVFMSSAIFHSVIGAFIWEALAIVTGVFLLFNVISGRLFLGDAGSYGLGTILVLGSFYAVNTQWISVEFAAVMMSYPCIEVLMSMLRRIASGRSMLRPDNQHLHNRIYERLSSITRHAVLANSATGLLVAGASTGVAFLGSYMGWLSPLDKAWGWVFCVQVMAYLITYTLLSRSAPVATNLATD